MPKFQEIELEETCKYITNIICEALYIFTDNTSSIHHLNSFLILFRYSNHTTMGDGPKKLPTQRWFKGNRNPLMNNCFRIAHLNQSGYWKVKGKSAGRLPGRFLSPKARWKVLPLRFPCRSCKPLLAPLQIHIWTSVHAHKLRAT